MSKFVVQRLAEHTERGNKWHLFTEHPDGARTTLGYHMKRTAAVTVARLLAGRRGKVEVRDKAVRIDAWRVA
ncbi:MAG: hypothetical protein EOR00_09615 [Mesorhizobium sp.]|uniref:hypothetical protein n=1 Tax=Mesorhizobium sp. TaxID=1871066 RepID=UPI000FE9FD36|nr:hypothetical protein [Mesorhizobium sp.]RWP18882.1 MAG: hypothetical protein EOR00_09615 [Mesorhizobium sp.]